MPKNTDCQMVVRDTTEKNLTNRFPYRTAEPAGIPPNSTKAVFQKSITVLSNQNNLLPFTRLDTLKVATVALGDTIISPFQRRVDSYVKAVHYNAGKQPTREQIEKLVRELKNYNLVILAVNNTKVSPATRYSLTDQQIDMLDKISKQSNTVFLSFMNPYSFQHLKGLENCKAIVLTYHDNARYKT
jgi:beta-N-acetylhexosaminidase